MKTNGLKSRHTIILSLMLSVILVLGSCNSSRTIKGGAAGAGTGALIGKKSDKTAPGTIIGVAVGGTTGALIGRYMDKQAEELEKDLKGAKVERVGNGIKITFDSGILFGSDQSNLKSSANANIEKLAKTLRKYDDTDILVEGHTDNIGSELYNRQLSENRAESVALRLTDLNVAAERIAIQGFGETIPVADNSTEAGRQQNRRVEIGIIANKKLQQAAERRSLEI